MSDDLKKLINEPVDKVVAGKTLRLTPMKLLSTLRAQEIVEPFVADLVDGDGTLNVTRLSMRYATRMFELCVVMLGDAHRGWLETLEEDQYEDLLWTLIGLNQDFFGRRVRSLMFAKAESLPPPADGKSTSPGTSPNPSGTPAEPSGGPTTSAP